MGISESFLVNAERLDPIIKTLIDNGEVPSKITEDELKTIGFENPADLLVIHILKELTILESDGSPTTLFKKLINADTSQMAIAEGMMHGYKDLIEAYPNIHKMQVDEIQEKISTLFEGKKTELVVKYMAQTFKKLVAYAGLNTFEDAYKAILGENEDVAHAASKEPQNGSPVVETVADIVKEEKGESNIESVLSEDAIKDVNKTPSSDEQKSEPKAMSNGEQKESDSTENNRPELPYTNSKSTATVNGSAAVPSSNKVQQAFIKKADLLYKLERFEELVPTLKELVQKFENSEDPALVEAVSKSVIRRATVLAKLKRTDELLPALDDVIIRFEDSENAGYFEHASMAMLNKASILESEEQFDGLLPLYEQIIERLEDSQTPKIKEKVDRVFLKRMDLILKEDGDKERSLQAINQLIDRVKDAASAPEYLEDAMFRKATMLEDMNNDEDALQAYSEFIEKFGEEALA